MRGLIRFLLGGSLLWTSAALAVSRVGGGTMSNTDIGLESLDIPAQFQRNPMVYSDDSVRLNGPLLFGGMGSSPTPQMIRIFLLQSEVPEVAGVADRTQFANILVAKGWVRVPTNDPCLEIYQPNSSTTLNRIVSWGAGHGLLFAGPLTLAVNGGIESAVESIHLLPGACAWK